MAEKFIDRLKKKGESVWRRIFAARAEADKEGTVFTDGYQKKMKAGSGIRIDNGDTIVNTTSSLNTYKFHYLYDAEGNLIAQVIPDNIGEGLVGVKDTSSNDEYEVSVFTDVSNLRVEITSGAKGIAGGKTTIKITNYRTSVFSAVLRRYNSDGSYSPGGLGQVQVPGNQGTANIIYTIVKGRNALNIY